MEWDPTEPAWQYELIDRVGPSLDIPQLERSLRRTPTERLEAARQLAQFAENVSKAHGRARPNAERESDDEG